MMVYWLEQVEADVPDHNDWFSTGEICHLQQLHVPKRRTDWRLGRWTAKRAVAAYLDLPDDRKTLAAIEIRPDNVGAPEAFLKNQAAGVSISISHSSGTAACAVGSSGFILGCDLELVEPHSPAFIADYFTADEQAMISRSTESQRDALTVLLWSAKESALKALRAGLRLDTRRVSANIQTETFSLTSAWSPLSVCCPNDQILQGWWQSQGKLTRTLVTDPTGSPPIVLEMRRKEPTAQATLSNSPS
jgi:4'-phosphopantetheinyl transferase